MSEAVSECMLNTYDLIKLVEELPSVIPFEAKISEGDIKGYLKKSEKIREKYSEKIKDYYKDLEKTYLEGLYMQNDAEGIKRFIKELGEYYEIIHSQTKEITQNPSGSINGKNHIGYLAFRQFGLLGYLLECYSGIDYLEKEAERKLRHIPSDELLETLEKEDLVEPIKYLFKKGFVPVEEMSSQDLVKLEQYDLLCGTEGDVGLNDKGVHIYRTVYSQKN